jgi:2-methylisocitrate lyase-like PEP mutase family enzyme
MPPSQADKVARFRALHAAPGAFVIPNPWDAGSARLLAGLGFPALATSSSASAGTRGRRDYGVTRAEALAMAAEIVAATDLPVSADLENGFGDSPEAVQLTVREAAAVGLAGCSIEDAPGTAEAYELDLAVERVAAAVEAARALPVPFVITARAENFVRGTPDLADTIRRLQAYEQAGADVLFAPGVSDVAALRTLCAAVTRPVNAIGSATHTVAQLAAAGVKRISLATSLYRAAMTALRDAASEARDRGTFTFAQRAMPGSELGTFMRE